MSEEKKFSTEDFAIGLVCGLFAGAAAAIFLAPSSGPRNRQRVSAWANDKKLNASEAIDKARDSLEKVVQKTESALGLQERGIRKKLDQIKSELEHFDFGTSK